jgi:hypothetical protein
VKLIRSLTTLIIKRPDRHPARSENLVDLKSLTNVVAGKTANNRVSTGNVPCYHLTNIDEIAGKNKSFQFPESF